MHAFLYKQHFYKQRQAKISKKYSKGYPNSLLKIIRFFIHVLKIMEDPLKIVQKTSAFVLMRFYD